MMINKQNTYTLNEDSVGNPLCIAIVICVQMRAWIHANFSLHVLTGTEHSKAEEADGKESEEGMKYSCIFGVMVQLF